MLKNIILSEQNLINTFSEKQKKNAIEYLKFKNNETNLSISKSELRRWSKGRKPFPIKTIEDLKKRNLLPLLDDDKRLPVLARVVGAMFSDGSLNYSHRGESNLKGDFSAKYETDILAFIKDMKSVFGEDLKFKIDQYFHKRKYGKARVCRIGKASICRFLACLGVPIGDKVLQPLLVPNWILNGNEEIKKNFLDGLLSSEIHTPSRQKHSYLPNMIGFSMSKIENLGIPHHIFLNTIKTLLEDLGIKTWKYILHGNIRTRKDGSVTHEWIIFITNNRENIINFYNTFPLLYSKNKKERLKQILIKDPHVILKNEQAIHVPKTKLIFHGNSATTTLPLKIRKFLRIRPTEFFFLTPKSNFFLVSKKSGKIKRRLNKGYIVSLPKELIKHLKVPHSHPYVRWWIRKKEVFLTNDLI